MFSLRDISFHRHILFKARNKNENDQILKKNSRLGFSIFCLISVVDVVVVVAAEVLLVTLLLLLLLLLMMMFLMLFTCFSD